MLEREEKRLSVRQPEASATDRRLATGIGNNADVADRVAVAALDHKTKKDPKIRDPHIHISNEAYTQLRMACTKTPLHCSVQQSTARQRVLPAHRIQRPKSGAVQCGIMGKAGVAGSAAPGAPAAQ